MKLLGLLVSLSLALFAMPAEAQQRWEYPFSREMEPRIPAPRLNYRTVRYGPSPTDHFWFVHSVASGRNPIVILVPGPEGLLETPRYPMTWLPHYLIEHGFSLAEIGLRERSGERAEQFLARVTRGIREVIDRAEELEIDPARIILLADGWGANTAMLLATQPRYLTEAGLNFGSLCAAVLIEGHGYDIAARLGAASAFRRGGLERYFGSSADALQAHSPIHQLAEPNARFFRFYRVAEDDDPTGETERLAQALRAAGARADVTLVQRGNQRSASAFLGGPNNVENDGLLQFLQEATAGAGCAR